MRDLVGPLVQLSIGKPLGSAHEGRTVGCQGRLFGKKSVHGLGAGIRRLGPIEVHQHLPPLGFIEQFEPRQRIFHSSRRAFQQPREVVAESLRVLTAKHARVKIGFETQRDPLLDQHKLQLERPSAAGKVGKLGREFAALSGFRALLIFKKDRRTPRVIDLRRALLDRQVILPLRHSLQSRTNLREHIRKRHILFETRVDGERPRIEPEGSGHLLMVPASRNESDGYIGLPGQAPAQALGDCQTRLIKTGPLLCSPGFQLGGCVTTNLNPVPLRTPAEPSGTLALERQRQGRRANLTMLRPEFCALTRVFVLGLQQAVLPLGKIRVLQRFLNQSTVLAAV